MVPPFLLLEVRLPQRPQTWNCSHTIFICLLAAYARYCAVISVKVPIATSCSCATDALGDRFTTQPVRCTANHAVQNVGKAVPLEYVSTPRNFSTGLGDRSEEHTSELQSRGQLVCRLLLEKKKDHNQQNV